MTHSLSTQLADVDLVGQAEMVRRGEVKPGELVEATIERIERVNPELNAVVTTLFDEARTEAVRVDRDDGPFAGVPYLVKDIGIGARGVRSTFGSSWVGDYAPGTDSVLAGRLRSSGLIFIGATAVPELAIAASTESRRFGPTRNPWATDRTAGGSSGGAAAAVASGVSPAAHASDGSGSIRIPASCCGLFGLKPSRGRITPAPDPGDLQGGIVQHAVSRTVRDSAALLDVIAGSQTGDRYIAPAPERPFVEEIDRDPGRLRVGVSLEPHNRIPVSRECIDAAEGAARLLERMGHHVEYAVPEIPADAQERVAALEEAAVASMLDRLEQSLGPATEPLPPVMRQLREDGRRVTAEDYLAADDALARIVRRASEFWDEYDLWLTPTLATSPIALGRLNIADEDVDRFWRTDRLFNPWCPIANWLGYPAATVPLHWSEDGLPIGIHLTGVWASETQLLRVCAQLEQAEPWAHRRPPVHALAAD